MSDLYIVSGYFEILHIGHIRYLEATRDLTRVCDDILVIVNNDKQLMAKKGYVLVNEECRYEIMSNISLADHVEIAVDDDPSISLTLSTVKGNFDWYDNYFFVNGGDVQNPDQVREKAICEKLGIGLKFVDPEKVESSSAITQRIINKNSRNQLVSDQYMRLYENRQHPCSD